jgi:hypothetical protein
MVIRTLATFILSTPQWVPTLEIKSGFDSFVLLGLCGVAWANRLLLKMCLLLSGSLWAHGLHSLCGQHHTPPFSVWVPLLAQGYRSRRCLEPCKLKSSKLRFTFHIRDENHLLYDHVTASGAGTRAQVQLPILIMWRSHPLWIHTCS